jgi:RNA 2',3'-cyclic 3'-phosphodiesterase
VIRAFVAVQLGPDVIAEIFGIQSQLKRSLKGIRWVNRENFHFTIKFLGWVEEKSIPSILDGLEQVGGTMPQFRIISGGIGVFPDIRRPRVLWVGLQGENLKSLAMEVERRLEPLGFEKEQRDFKPHLTLGRWREFTGSHEPLTQELERWKNHHFGESWIREMVLFQSVLKREGAIYSPLGVVPLKEAN